MTQLKSVVIVIAVMIGSALYGIQDQTGLFDGFSSTDDNPNSAIHSAYEKQQSDVLVVGYGQVTRVLRDDLKGSRHQRFILTLPTGMTVLVAHNIDLAPRIQDLKAGDKVSFQGEYEWNKKGGVVHWTHHDPAGRHPGGWLEHYGKRYE